MLIGIAQMGRNARKVIRRGDEREIHKLLKTESARRHGTDEKSPGAGDLKGKLAKAPPKPAKASSRK
jgi:hypothetical protein